MLGEEDEMCVMDGCYEPSHDGKEVCSKCFHKFTTELGALLSETVRLMIQRAVNRDKYPVEIVKADIYRVWPKDNRCPVFKTPFVVGGDLNTSPALDRIDSSKGYTPDNIQVISNLANAMKSSATPLQLLQFSQYHLQNEDYIMLESLIENITQWHKDRNLIDGSTDQAQYVKLIEEAGELAGNIARGKDVSDDIGDMIVVLANIAARNQLTLTQCCSRAWDDIKDRKGKMVDGVFIKEADE